MVEILNLALACFGLIFIGFACGKARKLPEQGLARMNFVRGWELVGGRKPRQNELLNAIGRLATKAPVPHAWQGGEAVRTSRSDAGRPRAAIASAIPR